MVCFSSSCLRNNLFDESGIYYVNCITLPLLFYRRVHSCLKKIPILSLSDVCEILPIFMLTVAVVCYITLVTLLSLLSKLCFFACFNFFPKKKFTLYVVLWKVKGKMIDLHLDGEVIKFLILFLQALLIFF